MELFQIQVMEPSQLGQMVVGNGYSESKTTLYLAIVIPILLTIVIVISYCIIRGILKTKHISSEKRKFIKSKLKKNY